MIGKFTHYLGSRRFLGIVCLLMGTGMLVVGLWPFNYLPRNQVSWLDEEGGVQLGERGQLFVSRSVSRPAIDAKTEGLTLQLSLRPDRTYPGSLPHILTFCDDKGREILYLGQWKNELIIRLMDPSPRSNRVVREGGADGMLLPAKPVLVTIVSGRDGTVIYGEGKAFKEYRGLDLASAIRDTPVRLLVLGNSAAGDSPWQGDVNSLAILDREIGAEEVGTRARGLVTADAPRGTGSSSKGPAEPSGRGTDDILRDPAGNGWRLDVPERFTPMSRKWLSWPGGEDARKGWFVFDTAVNFLGFVPLGAALCLFFIAGPESKGTFPAMLLPVLIGAILSLFIELNQVFLVSRDSSLLDLMLNTLGAGCGTAAVATTKKHPVSSQTRN